MRFVSMLLLLLCLEAHGVRDYDHGVAVHNRPRRGFGSDMDNISLRLEGQHLTRTCPNLIEQKMKNIPPRQCLYFEVERRPMNYVTSMPCKPVCCKSSNRLCRIARQHDKKIYNRLLFRKVGTETKCIWEGCPHQKFYNLTTSQPPSDPKGVMAIEHYREPPTLDTCIPTAQELQCGVTIPMCPLTCPGAGTPGGPGST
ncbi:MAG: hypothetical protein AB7G93_20930 [Bdellovibrionales bacterium]